MAKMAIGRAMASNPTRPILIFCFWVRSLKMFFLGWTRGVSGKTGGMGGGVTLAVLMGSGVTTYDYWLRCPHLSMGRAFKFDIDAILIVLYDETHGNDKETGGK